LTLNKQGDAAHGIVLPAGKIDVLSQSFDTLGFE
jgi:hypothetical protein